MIISEKIARKIAESFRSLPIMDSYKNGNHFTCIFNDGTRIRITEDTKAKSFEYDFPSNADLKISNYCPVGCKYCHESSTVNGRHGDILNLPFVDTLMHGTELAIGGGSALSHPDLIPFLEKLKKRRVLANLTVNQKELMIGEYADKMKKILSKNLVNGVGISLTDNKTFNKIADEVFGDFPGLMVHTIAGIFTEDDIDCVKGRKMLILGYKDLHGRRAGDFYADEKDSIQKNIDWLKGNLKSISKDVKLMSFDCLGIKQLDPKKNLELSEEDWQIMFQGDDYSAEASTLYIDAVTRTVARASTHPLEDRPRFSGESISELFEMSKRCLSEGNKSHSN